MYGVAIIPSWHGLIHNLEDEVEVALLHLTWSFVGCFACVSGWGVRALYLLFVFVKMSSLSDIILLKQVVVLWIAHKAIITSLEGKRM